MVGDAVQESAVNWGKGMINRTLGKWNNFINLDSRHKLSTFKQNANTPFNEEEWQGALQRATDFYTDDVVPRLQNNRVGMADKKDD